MRAIYFSAIAILVAAPASAEVKKVDERGFESAHEVTLAKPPAEVFASLRAPAKWWNKDHTYTGDSANLWMDAQAGGCFCEKLPERGSVEHLRIVFAEPGKLLRLTGGLGPLQGEAVSGVMTWTLAADGGGTRVRMNYVVSGQVRMEGGMAALAPLVDRVLGQQVAGLVAAVDQPAP